MENQRLLSRDREEDESSIEEEQEWSDNASSYSSYYSDSDSTIPDWEPYINDFTGDLLYIDCHPFVTQNKDHGGTTKANSTQPEPFSKSQLRRSTRGKFLRLIRRRESKRRSRKGQKNVEVNVVESSNTSKVKFQDFQEGEEKTVMLEIDSENRYNLSSDKSFAESLLGLNVSTLSDGTRVMIAGFSYDSKAKNDRNIKIGDWLKSINDIEVNVSNLDDILQKFINHSEVLLKLQRVAATEVTKDPPINELNLESNFVKELLNNKQEEIASVLNILLESPVGIVFINTEELNENNQQYEDVVYCFPKPLQKNVLCNSRGLFITLNHLLPDITKSKPHKTSIALQDRLAHIVYTEVDKKLFLLMLPDNKVAAKEVKFVQKEVLRFLEFSHESLDKCFASKELVGQLDKYFSRFFMRILNNGQWTTSQQFLDSENKSVEDESNCFFESAMPLVPTLRMQDEAMMQIDDALAELEASDYREWNEEPLDCQRLFTILGSAVFHLGYLLASHFVYDDLIDVYCFCRQQGILYLSQTEPVKSLVMWKEVFPSSCRTVNENLRFPEARRYLLVVGAGKDILAVIMEAGGCTEPPEPNLGPDAFYVEEAQATLAHIQELGLGELADRNLGSNGGYQVAAPVPVQSRKKDFIGGLHFSKSGSSTDTKETPSPKKSEVTSILKRRSSDHNVQGAYDDSFDNYSEGSGSQGYSERLSEISDDSAMRGKGTRHDSNDESDGEEFGGGSHLSTYSFDVSELRHTLLNEAGDMQPAQLTSGFGDILYHFVQLDTTQGVLISPVDCCLASVTYKCIVDNFRKCCQSIHKVFENTRRFKTLPPQEVAKSLMNKSLVAIKEYGVIFECPYLDDKESNGKHRISYWVIGRLFYTPHPREIYICCQDSIPQNMVDVAFKLGINVAF